MYPSPRGSRKIYEWFEGVRGGSGSRCFCDYGLVSHGPSRACLFPPNLTGKCAVTLDARSTSEFEVDDPLALESKINYPQVKLGRLLSRS